MLHCVRRSAKILWIMEFVCFPNVNVTGCLLCQRVIFLHSFLLVEMLADVFMLCNCCVCRSFHTIMQKTFLWLICVSSMAGVFARILAGSLMQSCLAMRLICWKSVYRYFFSFASIDLLGLFTLNGCIN